MIGLIAGVLVVEAVFFVDRKLKIDDPVGAIGVHFVNGIWGVLAVGIFASGKYGIDAFGPAADGTMQGWNLTTTQIVDGHATGVTGILYGGSGGGQLIAQVVGALLTIIVVMGGFSWAFFLASKALFGGIRSDEDDEIAGLDLPEMGVPAYPDFVGTHEAESGGGSAPSKPEKETSTA